ncbi:MAG: acyl-CoA dehydrogenase family protein [Planctomycetes bacterium]|nr:acyl-CoA dehydrogenase family protein [Planctomycetota bacterium]
METRNTDYYLLDDLLTDEQKNIRAAVRDFVQTRFQPTVQQNFEDGKFPIELASEMADLGLFGPTLEEKYGGAGLDSVCYGLICQELERGDSGLRSFASVQSSLAMYAIYKHGTEEQRMKYLPKMAKGELIGCFGLTEPDHGSDPGGMKTHATKVDGGYVISGQKMWITNGTISDLAVVWAKLDGEIRGFIVEKGSKGFTAPEQHHKFSLRASITSELLLDEVRVPSNSLLPNVSGLKGPLQCLTQARFGIAFGVLGSAMDCYERTIRYTTERKQFDRPLAANQLVQAELAYMITEITKGQLLAHRLATLKDAGKMTPTHVSMAKMNNCAIALEIARKARDLHGANGISYEFHICRHMANLETVKTYEGTHNIHMLSIGRDVTGISAFS